MLARAAFVLHRSSQRHYGAKGTPSAPPGRLALYLPSFPLETSLGGYWLEERLGQGGMGVVYRAVREAGRVEVALKFMAIPSEGDAEGLAVRFAREAELLSQFHHPFIVGYIDSGEVEFEGRCHPYFAMEFLPGLETLDCAWAERRDLEWLLDRLDEVLQALECMHGHADPVIHRDLKPANLGVASDGHVRVLDLGVARSAASADLTQTGAGLGTLGYMAPEQMRDARRVDPRADLYSLGIIMLELLGGAHPFRGMDWQEMVSAMWSGATPAPPRPVPRDLEPFLSKLRAPRADARFASAREALDALRALRRERAARPVPEPPVAATLPAVRPSPPRDVGATLPSVHRESGPFPPLPTPVRPRRLQDVALVLVEALCLLLLARWLLDRPLTWASNQVYDAMLVSRASLTAPAVSPLARVEIDDASIQRLGRFPWSRSRFADLVDRLAEAGAETVLLDVIFSEAADAPGDERFATAMRKAGNVVLATAGPLRAPRSGGALDQPGHEADSLHVLSNPLEPLPAFARAAAGVGSIAVLRDADGVLRRYPFLVSRQEQPFPSLACAAIQRHAEKQGVSWSAAVDRHGVLLLDYSIATDQARRASFTTVLDRSATDLRATFQGATVLVLATYTGGVDFGTTPLAPEMPLGLYHLYACSTVFGGRPIRWLGPVPPLAVAFLLLFVLISPPWEKRPLAVVLVAVALGALTLGGGWVLFLVRGIYCDVVFPLVTLACYMAGSGVARWRRTLADQQLLAGTLQRFVGPQVLRRLERSRGMRARPQRLEMTILFCDLGEFSLFAERADPEQVMEVLTTCHTAMIEQVDSHGGSVDKLMGDGLLAWWADEGSPSEQAASAVEASVQMVRKMPDLNRFLESRGYPSFAIRVGLATGFVTLGEIGSPRFANFTVVGSHVTLAEKLQASAGRNEIFASERTWHLARDGVTYTARTLAPLTVRGFAAPVRAFSIDAR